MPSILGINLLASDGNFDEMDGMEANFGAIPYSLTFLLQTTCLFDTNLPHHLQVRQTHHDLLHAVHF
ncbi:MAG: hypothetical protein IPF38_18900 [Burkholderiales bacterium]|nr:hypothetical protein [Burkholderiales bacterium]